MIQSQNQSQQSQVTSQQQQQQQQQGGGQPDCRSEATSVCGDNSSVLSGFSSGPVNQQAGHQASGNSLPPGSSAPTMTSASKVESVQEMLFELGRKSHIHPVEIIFFYYVMSSSDLPKLGTELTKIGHIFRK